MKKMLYLTEDPLADPHCIGVGVYKKTIMQMKFFKKNGYSPYLVYINGIDIAIYDYANDTYEYIYFLNSKDYYEKIIGYIVSANLDFLYMRKKNIIDLQYMRFIEKLRKCFNKPMLIEFPLLPYGDEYVTRADKVLIKADKYYRNFLIDYFDISVNSNGYQEVFGLKSISMVNGVDFDSVRLKKHRKSNKDIVIMSATSMALWNGYERFVEGLKNYYCQSDIKYKVYFKLAGTGPDLPFYKRIVKEYGLEKYVTFYNSIIGKELDKLFDESDIALNSLGLYKRKTHESGGIRAGEYSARGIPFIYAGNDIVFHGKNKYTLEFPNDESPIDINRIIAFYEELEKEENYNMRLREFSKKYVDWEYYIKQIVQAIEELEM